MHVLVTGGAGFIGSHVVAALVARGHAVRVLDSLHPLAHGRPPERLEAGVEYRWTDVADLAAVREAVDGLDAVSHQASVVGLERDFGNVDEYARANDLGTAVLLRALHERSFEGRLVLASSMVVYGEGAYECRRHGPVRPGPRDPVAIAGGHFEPQCPRCGEELAPAAIAEDARLDPRSVYAATKLHQEHLCGAYGRAHGRAVTALRYHNVYGPDMPRDTPYAGVASIFRSELEAGRPPRVLEDGQQLRDFVHVTDVAVGKRPRARGERSVRRRAERRERRAPDRARSRVRAQLGDLHARRTTTGRRGRQPARRRSPRVLRDGAGPHGHRVHR